MSPGSVFFDKDFHFHDGESGEKLFVVLGSDRGVSIVSKTTSRPYGKGINFGCQPNDRFHNFHLPVNVCYLKKNTWICLNEFYELKQPEVLQKRFDGIINPVCELGDEITRQVQDCALSSDDLSVRQEKIIVTALVNPGVN